MNRLLIILLLFITSNVKGQGSDVILLKKNDKTIDRYYPGKNIQITSPSGALISATINDIRNDSLYLKEYIVRTAMTTLGVYVLDTMNTYYYTYHYKEIKGIGKIKKGGLNMTASAGALMGGGGLLVLASGVVYLVDRKNFSPTLLLASAGLAGVGYLIAKTTGKGMVIGKKYHLEYLNLQNKKTESNTSPKAGG